MKLKSLYLLLALCSLSSVQALENQVAQKNRIYVKPTDIAFQNNEMYVSVNNNQVQTNAVYSDTTGVFVDANKIGWRCGRCNYVNTENLWTCDNCGHPRNQYSIILPENIFSGIWQNVYLILTLHLF